MRELGCGNSSSAPAAVAGGRWESRGCLRGVRQMEGTAGWELREPRLRDPVGGRNWAWKQDSLAPGPPSCAAGLLQAQGLVLHWVCA